MNDVESEMRFRIDVAKALMPFSRRQESLNAKMAART